MTDPDRPTTSESIDDPVAAARGTVYGTLASLFEEPTEQTYEGLSDGTLAADIDRLIEHADLDVAAPPLVTADDYELLCARFNDIFAIGYPDPPVALYESEYESEGQWEEINLDLARAYDYFGVEVDESRREHHDHLQLELEFAGYLSRLAAMKGDDAVRRARRDFLDRHLAPLVEEIGEAMDDEVETGIYDDLVEFTNGFVAADLADLDSRLDVEVSRA
ncbi:putative component of anaerobic dehydrogenase [Halanaeroarchaeum sp. HSR-CO]|uniref:molecular chaperone TorD family protein n=1 Tax=Halanaeroarchaeum sp. HSR-CO TaxID=2866382 RepID=UPI00217D5AF1|nr:molecular chaperone TorD family protein [Halanaeroarchaeum sp. HSR-CO]UWG48546.1 putative component of anaerobic dehydrogenase [Halanaeroarchaeum sp. HSR-CO]